MVNLGLIYLARDGNNLNMDLTLVINIGRLSQYIYESINKLSKDKRYGLIVKDGLILMNNNGGPIYTDRLLAAARTYHAGDKLHKSVNNYINTIGNRKSCQATLRCNAHCISRYTTFNGLILMVKTK